MSKENAKSQLQPSRRITPEINTSNVDMDYNSTSSNPRMRDFSMPYKAQSKRKTQLSVDLKDKKMASMYQKHKKNLPSEESTTELSVPLKRCPSPKFQLSNMSTMRASQPYCFTPVGGAPSFKGKKMAEFTKKVQASCSMTRDSLQLINQNINMKQYQSVDTTQPTQVFHSLSMNHQAISHLKNQRNLGAYTLLSGKKKSDFIPCLFLKYDKGSSKIFLYFHANAEDLGRAYKFLNYVHVYLRMHVMAVEYPGYGIYEGDHPNAEKIISDADIMYNFLLKKLNWKEQDIIICGRSIGSGPGCYLASTYKPSSLVLISPHTSIRGIVKDQFLGKFTQYVVAERFRNVEAIAKVVCPTFILHGLKDNLVHYNHAQVLCDTCGGPSFLLLPEQMDHNNLDVIGDLIAPLSEFLDNFAIVTNNQDLQALMQNQNGPKSCLNPQQPSQRGQEMSERQETEEIPVKIDKSKYQNVKVNENKVIGETTKNGLNIDMDDFEDYNNIDEQLDNDEQENLDRSDERDLAIPTENSLKLQCPAINRQHPAFNDNLNKKKVFQYKGPFLIIDAQYYERPEELIENAKHALKNLQKDRPFDGNLNSKFTLFRQAEQLKCANGRQSIDPLDADSMDGSD